EDLLVLEVAQPLEDHLARGGGRDTTESVRRVVELGPELGPPRLGVLARGDDLARPHRDVAGAPVDLDARVRVRVRRAVVRRQQRLLDRLDEGVQRDVALVLHEPQRGHVDVHHASWVSCAPRKSSSTGPRTTSAGSIMRSPSSPSTTSRPGSASVRRPVTSAPSRIRRRTRRVRARRKWRSSVIGRDVPGVDTSSTYSPRTGSASSSAAETRRETSLNRSEPRLPTSSSGRSTTTRTTDRRPALATSTSSRKSPAR